MINSNLKALFQPQEASNKQGVEIFRERLLHYVILSLAIFGFIAYLPSLYFAVKFKLYGIVILDTLVVAYIWALHFRKLSFKKKSIGMLIIFYCLGAGLLIGVGPAGAGALWLFLFSIMTCVFLGARPTLISLGVNIITWVILSIPVFLNQYPWMGSLENAKAIWLIVGINCICINAIAAISLSILIKQLSRLFQQEKTISMELKQEIQTRTWAEANNKELIKQLNHSQKMEAIGTLAGGVAHDLNNVLSAQVGYPDLILMDLPKDSPLQKPILKIQESAQKAAAIVQDLLTMARRGVVITDVINLNQVVDMYLRSPEYERLKLFNQDAIITSNTNPNLFNIIGSSVHLFKVIMNLVNNAAEAMPQGGNIFISTQNRYIEKPLKGYKSFKKGNYAVLSVSDTGTGISPKDIERIFEPFYTKKVMGKSGTGLGMAVVWGTMKDHKGYIDVKSTENSGTTFTLYFPTTQDKIAEHEKILPMKQYMGKGESILVVDDTEGQREIACDMLMKFGYTVETVASGESAVDYLKDKHADLVILDMIMDPGIDGCETYKQICEIHPHQKAIITSGFSETGRVKEAQKLGAGEYIKKPYTFEQIGLSVKKALEI
jgi:signal transduction histidine kinase